MRVGAPGPYLGLMLHTPDGPVFPEYEDLADRVVNGDGVLWAGDPFMSLHVGAVTRGHRVVGHRLEVHRWCEDGETRLIGSWHPGEMYRVPADLARMRSDRPGGSTVLDDIDTHNAGLEAKASTDFQDEYGELVERLAYKLVFEEQGHPKNQHLVTDNPLAKES